MRDLTALFEPVIQSMGYELVGVEFQGSTQHGTLRVYIDHENGIGVDDCTAISHQISGILDVEEPIQQAYDWKFLHRALTGHCSGREIMNNLTVIQPK
jgi:ribosome maturation factor RimP